MKKRVGMALFMAAAMTCSSLPAVALAEDDVDVRVVEATEDVEEPTVEEEPAADEDATEEPAGDEKEAVETEEEAPVISRIISFFAASGNQNGYKDSDIYDEATGLYKLPMREDSKNKEAGNSTKIDKDGVVNYVGVDKNIDFDDPAADYALWELVDTRWAGKNGDVTVLYAELIFVDGAGKRYEATVDTFNEEQHNDKYVVATPSDWKIVDGWSYSKGAVDDKNKEQTNNFKCSESYKHEAEVAKVTVTAAVDAWYHEITPHEYYERDVDKYYERSVDEYYERTVDEYYERTVDNYYERTVDEYYVRPVTDIYQRYAQRYLVPVFEKKLEGAHKGTLVTRLDYTDNTAKATPKNGGAFGNGHTYVTVNVAEASKEGGEWYTIADSSKNNGKKTPDQYNKPIEYQYNVKINEDGTLTVSCGKDLAYASVGAEVWTKAPADFNSAPKHQDGSVRIDLPWKDGANTNTANNGKGNNKKDKNTQVAVTEPTETVDLYVHFENLGWYETAANGDFVYQFKEWKYDDSRTEYDEEYTKIDTVYGDYKLDKTEYGEYELVDTVNGEYELVDTQYGDYELAKTEHGDYELVNTVYGDYELVRTENDSERVNDVYTGELTLTVDGKEVEPGAELNLKPGVEHKFVLSGDGFSDVTVTKRFDAGDNETVKLTADVQNADETLETEKHYADREATEYFDNLEATKHYADKEAEKHYADKEATEHYADKEATHHEEDEFFEVQKDEFIYRPDIHLGDETDPYGEYAERL